MLKVVRRVCRLMCGALLLAGCSKPVSPVSGLDPSGGTDPLHAQPVDPNGNSLLRLHFVGDVASLSRDFQPRVERRKDFYVFVNDTLPPFDAPVRDTIPVGAVLKDVRWRHGHAGAAAAFANGAAEPLDEQADLLGSDGGAHGEPLPVGIRLLTLRAPKRLGSANVLVWIMVGFRPGPAWFAGPDPDRFPLSRDGDGRAVEVLDWRTFATSPAWPPDGRPYFGPDSLAFLPSARRPVHDDFDRRTFYELWHDRIYARSEGDTVHQGSWVVVPLGGYDRDSRYVPRIGDPGSTLPAGYASRPDLYPLLSAQGLRASPSGFRYTPHTKLANGQILLGSQSTEFPTWDITSVFHFPAVACYAPNPTAGKAYLSIASEDADGLVGGNRGDVVAIADRVDAGGGSPQDRLDRRSILTYHVREAPAADAGAMASAPRNAGRVH